MHLLPKVIAAALVLVAAPAIAQDHSMHGGAAAPESKLPAICLENAKGHDMSAMAAAPAEGDEAHKALAATMDAMHGDMAAGMTATDIDVAFVCGMIPTIRAPSTWPRSSCNTARTSGRAAWRRR
ncbi:hypothetical protein [Paradevosia shaoguanensis]|uniref:hypothetical protein n=1 Tax=Paradevosia shaoguanensis TaxID=1335043 RepID=UPI003CCCA049